MHQRDAQIHMVGVFAHQAQRALGIGKPPGLTVDRRGRDTHSLCRAIRPQRPLIGRVQADLRQALAMAHNLLRRFLGMSQGNHGDQPLAVA